jgi:hypothetical protein
LDHYEVFPVRTRKSFVTLLILLTLAACNPVAEKSAAEACASQMFSAREVGQTQKVLLMYDDRPGQGTPREQWSKMLVAVENKLGRPTAHNLTNWNVALATNKVGSGVFVTLSYAVRYERAEGTETLVLFKPRGSSDFRIIGHNFNSPALLFDQESPKQPDSRTPTRSS